MNEPPPQWEQALRHSAQEHTRERPDADRTLRLAATIADILLFFLTCSVANKILAAGEIAFVSPNLESRVTWLFRATSVVTIATLYFGVSTHLLGGTLGKVLLGLRVISVDGSNLRLTQALIRDLFAKYLLGILSAGIIPMTYLIGWRPQPWHDQLLMTTVKRVHGKP